MESLYEKVSYALYISVKVPANIKANIESIIYLKCIIERKIL